MTWWTWGQTFQVASRSHRNCAATMTNSLMQILTLENVTVCKCWFVTSCLTKGNKAQLIKADRSVTVARCSWLPIKVIPSQICPLWSPRSPLLHTQRYRVFLSWGKHKKKETLDSSVAKIASLPCLTTNGDGRLPLLSSTIRGHEYEL